MSKSRGLRKAIKAAGNSTKLARKLRVTRAAIAQWDKVPIGRVAAVERHTGVPRHELRPDFYPPPAAEVAG